MLVAAALLLVSFLGLMGVVLDQAFQNSAEQGVSERLLLQTYGLLAVAEETDSGVFMPEKLQEPDFNQLGTGLYGLILDGGGKELWRSASSLDLSIDLDEKPELTHFTESGVPRFGRIHTDDQTEFFFLSYKVLWQISDQNTVPYVFAVLQTMDPYLGEVQGFRNSLWGWLVGVVAALTILQALVMNWELAPLKKLAGDLKAIEDGKQDRLEADYPEELEGITRNLNLLLSSERQQREKYRTTLADLAHSLKTPLAILRGASTRLADLKPESEEDEYASVQESIDNQVARMDQIIGYQLQRAVATSPHITRKALPITPILNSILDVMGKIYESREITFDLDLVDGTFYGDERDIMELLGNIIDNACKYGRHLVKVKIEEHEHSGGLRIMVEDDGPGIVKDQRESVLKRGTRLDSRESGQGIGLAVVSEIVKRYDGSVSIEDSPLGGARIVISTMT